MNRARLSALAALLPDKGRLLPPADAGAARLGFGADTVDARLGGGLAAAALHELYPAAAGDATAAAAVALLLAGRNARPGPIIWLRPDRAARQGRPYGLGLAALGLDPARLLLVQAPDMLAVLRAGADAVACGAVATVILEVESKGVDLTATRRLALAAARSGVTTLLLRSGEIAPSAADTRWQVAAAPSRPLPANAPGPPAFALTLLRHRGGLPGFSCLLEWDRDRAAFAAADPRVAPAVAAERAAVPRRPAPRRRAA